MIIDSLKPLAYPVAKLQNLPGNPRVGDVQAIARSYEEFGQRKPIIARPDGTVIAGNHQLKAAIELGWEEIAVVFVNDDDQTARAYALADNRTADLGYYDDELLGVLLKQVSDDPELLAATGYSEADLLDHLGEGDGPGGGGGEDDDEDFYTKVVNIPQYEIVGDEPAVGELYDDTRTRQLQQRIASVDLPQEVAEFLTLASYRHTVFNYRKIAEWYPHQSADIQRLIEDSALVIIDYDDAIAKGYVRFSEAIKRLEERDHSAES